MPNFSIPASALDSYGVVMQATAHNIANVNTDGFQSQRVILQSGPQQDQGVRVGAIVRDTSPGPAIINHLSENDPRASTNAADRAALEDRAAYENGVCQDVEALQEQNLIPGEQAQSLAPGVTEGSNTDLAKEFTTMMVTENAYSAAAATIRAWDEMTGAILNVKT